MKTIKIIDILCYISIGEHDKIPKKIKWRDGTWKYDDRMQDYTNGHLMLFEQLKIIRTKEFLNDEVEILDEEDEFEDIVEYGKPVLLELQCEDIKLRDLQSYMYLLAKDQNTLIKNQKKIIEMLKKEGK